MYRTSRRGAAVSSGGGIIIISDCNSCNISPLDKFFFFPSPKKFFLLIEIECEEKVMCVLASEFQSQWVSNINKISFHSISFVLIWSQLTILTISMLHVRFQMKITFINLYFVSIDRNCLIQEKSLRCVWMLTAGQTHSHVGAAVYMCVRLKERVGGEERYESYVNS